MKMITLKIFLAYNREKLIENSIKYTKEFCGDLGTETERQVKREWQRKNRMMFDLPVKRKWRDLYTSIDGVTQEIKDRFKQLHLLV